MADEITDDLKDAQDITKAISELMSGDLQSAADGVGDKVKEIQTRPPSPRCSSNWIRGKN